MNPYTQAAMERVITAFDELERIWLDDAPTALAKSPKGYGHMIASRVGEARAAHQFGINIGPRIRRHFSIHGIAARYGIVSRTLQDAIYYTTWAHPEK